jgi:hypothetical protein
MGGSYTQATTTLTSFGRKIHVSHAARMLLIAIRGGLVMKAQCVSL